VGGGGRKGRKVGGSSPVTSEGRDDDIVASDATKSRAVLSQATLCVHALVSTITDRYLGSGCLLKRSSHTRQDLTMFYCAVVVVNIDH
jgi:hypothetical protein